jgi:hypothetical protein
MGEFWTYKAESKDWVGKLPREIPLWDNFRAVKVRELRTGPDPGTYRELLHGQYELQRAQYHGDTGKWSWLQLRWPNRERHCKTIYIMLQTIDELRQKLPVEKRGK